MRLVLIRNSFRSRVLIILGVNSFNYSLFYVDANINISIYDYSL